MPISLRLPEDVEMRLNSLSVKTGRTKTFYAIEAIREYLEDLEDVYLAQDRLEQIRSGKTTTIPLDEVMKNYGMDD